MDFDVLPPTTAVTHPCAEPCAELLALRSESVELREYIHDVQRGSEVAQEMVIQQFQEVDRILTLLQSENALRKSLLDATDQLSIIYADRSGTVGLFNRGAENILGYSAAQVVGRRSLLEFHAPEELAAMERESGQSGVDGLIALARRGSMSRIEWSYVHASGRRIPINLSISAVRDQDEHVTGIVCSAMDITDIKATESALRASEARYREMSITDNLTQLYNARHFYAQLQDECERTRRYQRPLCVLVMDVDNFKSYNDTYGHLEGDRVLTRVGEIIRGCLRRTDSAYRYGGEEFVVLLPETALDSAAIVAERIRSRFALVVFEPRPGVFDRRTLSIGAAQLRADEQPTDLVRRADACAYQAKARGKNCVVLAEEADEPDPAPG